MHKNKILQYFSSKHFWQKKLTTKPRSCKRLQIFPQAEAAEDAKNCALSSPMHWRQWHVECRRFNVAKKITSCALSNDSSVLVQTLWEKSLTRNRALVQATQNVSTRCFWQSPQRFAQI
jgi:hypothetical protein